MLALTLLGLRIAPTASNYWRGLPSSLTTLRAVWTPDSQDNLGLLPLSLTELDLVQDSGALQGDKLRELPRRLQKLMLGKVLNTRVAHLRELPLRLTLIRAYYTAIRPNPFLPKLSVVCHIHCS